MSQQANGFRGVVREARPIALSIIVTLLFAPFSVAATTFLTALYSKPRPRIEYVAASRMDFANAPEESLRSQVVDDPVLRSGLDQFFDRQADSSAQSCRAWLDGEAWDSRCLLLYRGAAHSLAASASSAALVLAKDGPQFGGPTVDDERDAAKLAMRLAAALDALAKKPEQPSGGVSIKVGILNVGLSDGAVTDQAELTISGHKIHMYADKYTPIKAHDFSEVEFISPGWDQGAPTGQYDMAEKKEIQAVSLLVEAGKPLDYSVSITLGDEKAAMKGSIEP